MGNSMRDMRSIWHSMQTGTILKEAKLQGLLKLYIICVIGRSGSFYPVDLNSD